MADLETPSTDTPDTKSAFSFNFDRLAAIFAIAVSFAAMGISLLEVSAIQAQQRASVWPYVEITERYNSDGFAISLSNKGVGPAIMGEVRLIDKGAPVVSLDALIRNTVGEEDAFSYDVYGASDPSNGVVAASEVYTLFSVPWEPRTRRFVERAATSVDVRACYCSIHDECWTVSMNQKIPETADSCPRT
ncbi:MAG: hypothetical protein AAGK23_11645 [Pseudomonadota bacterium]